MAAHITWNDYYTVGDALLDAEHKQIIGIINELYDAMERGNDRKVLKRLLDHLARYGATHFRHEEQVMHQCGYPELPKHRTVHARLRCNTASLRDNLDLVAGRDLLRFLKDWWLGHIQDEDKKYSPYVSADRPATVAEENEAILAGPST
jgi:hemerythrin